MDEKILDKEILSNAELDNVSGGGTLETQMTVCYFTNMVLLMTGTATFIRHLTGIPTVKRLMRAGAKPGLPA